MAYTLEMLEKLKTAIGKGVTHIEYEDKIIKYRSLDEMLKIIRLMEEELGLKKKSARLFAEHDKGLC